VRKSGGNKPLGTADIALQLHGQNTLSYLGIRRCFITKATISSKGQIAIPKRLRERLNLRAGTQVSIDVQGEALIMKRMVSGLPDWRTMEGMARGGESLTKALVEERAAELAHDNTRINQGR
jgi:AbrB family looped-hinge helix DNA binding protein